VSSAKSDFCLFDDAGRIAVFFPQADSSEETEADDVDLPMPHGRHIAMVTEPENVELVEVVDRDGNVIEVVRRTHMRRDRLRHRSVFIAVINDDGELLVHQRSEHKDVWPGWWDVAVGGVVGCGETYLRHCCPSRELREELGIDVATPDHAHWFTGAYADHTVQLVAAFITGPPQRSLPISRQRDH
jgi:hypothetical protein